MFRLLAYLIVIVVLISIIRSVAAYVMRVFYDVTVRAAAQQRDAPAAGPLPLTGELKKDPVCGTYTSAATSLQKTVAGQTYYFCSPQCRDKFAAVKS